MTTMTIHADDVFAEALRSHARMSGKNISQTVKDLLAPMLGIVKRRNDDADNPFMKFCGVLPKDASVNLGKAIAAHRRIDSEMWK